jgi:anti-sigma regulatory factor (Ser/Thr protein kinase)
MASLSNVLPDLLIAASEAAANAILHSGTKEFRVTWRSTRERVEITVEDDGIFLDTVPLPEIDGIGHRGISLMAATMDELSLIEGRRDRPGTRVRLVKVLRRAGKDSRSQGEVGRQASRSPA